MTRARLAGLLLLALMALYLYFSLLSPSLIVSDLKTQLLGLSQKSAIYKERGDEVTALKFEQLSFLLSPPVKDAEKVMKDLQRRSLKSDVGASYVDHLRAEKLVTEEVRTLGEPLLSHLALVLVSVPSDKGYACIALRVLAGLSTERLRPTVSNLIKKGHNDLLTREAVIELLRMKDKSLEAELIKLVKNWRGWGRQYPIYVLGRQASSASVPVILSALEDSSPAVRRHSVLAIKDLAGGEALAPLRFMLSKEKDPIARSHATAVLAFIRRKLPELEKASGTSSIRPSGKPIR